MLNYTFYRYYVKVNLQFHVMKLAYSTDVCAGTYKCAEPVLSEVIRRWGKIILRK